MSYTISKAILWLAWLLTALIAVLGSHYLVAFTPELNSFSKFDTFVAGMFCIPIIFCAGFRFWLSRVRNPWLAIVPFLLGVFFAWQAGLYGIYLCRESCIAFQLLSALLFLLFLPLFVRPERIPPSLPKAN